MAIKVIASACFGKNCIASSNHDSRSKAIGAYNGTRTFSCCQSIGTLPTEGGPCAAPCSAEACRKMDRDLAQQQKALDSAISGKDLSHWTWRTDFSAEQRFCCRYS